MPRPNACGCGAAPPWRVMGAGDVRELRRPEWRHAPTPEKLNSNAKSDVSGDASACRRSANQRLNDASAKLLGVAGRDLTFDMSGGPKGAKRPLERPLDGGVRRHGPRSDGCLPLRATQRPKTQLHQRAVRLGLRRTHERPHNRGERWRQTRCSTRGRNCAAA